MDITGIPLHTTLLAKMESLKCIIEGFKVSITRDMKGLLKDQLDAREIGGQGYVQSNLLVFKLNEIITQNKVTTNHSNGETEEKVLHIVEDGVSSEDNIMIVPEEERDNYYYGENGKY